MRKNLKLLSVALCFLLTFSLVSCSFDSKTNTNSKSAKKIQAEFDEFLNEEFIDTVTSDTITLHYNLKDPSSYGIKDIPATLGDFSVTNIEDGTDSKENKKILKKLKSYDYSCLTKDQKLTYDILKKYLETAALTDGLDYYATILGPTTGFQANLPVTLAEYKFYSKDDVEDYLKILELLEDYFKNIISFEQKKSKKGLFMADFAVDDIVSQCKEFISSPEDNYLIPTFDNKIDTLSDLSDEEKASYKEKNKDLIINTIVPTYQNLIDSLNDLKGSGKNDGGLCNFKKGKEYYEALVANTVGSDKSIDDITDMVKQRLVSKFTELSTILNSSPDIIEKYSNQTPESTDPNQILELLKQRMTDYYPKAADASYKVLSVDPSLEEHLSPAFFMVPPIDDYSNNVIYINNSQVDESSLFSTLAHEGYPGHLYQVTYFNSTNPYPIRHLLNFGGYTEGWATYVEMQSYELTNCDDNNLIKFNQAYSEICLAIPTLIDIQVNYNGWTLKDTEDFLSDYGYDSSIAESIYHTVIEDPANYLQYYVGYLEFAELRDNASKELKDNFNLKDFNKVILDVGPAPFSILEKQVNKYIKNNK